ncbi:MAG: exodeoxyribonuclease III [Hyphomicrobiaceae bacterium]|nr:MAG: exodeoxyribonuclease III [Hyphomicrobiaceae bacterium]
MRIATWNINGIKARIDNLVTWLKEASPDVALLQETKTVDDAFPREPLEALGYNIAAHGEKGFNGVALLSKRPLQEVRFGLPGDGEDSQCRYVEGIVSSGAGVVRVASIYLPNGNPIGTAKFDYKLKWLGRLESHARDLLALEEPFVLGGDYNVIPEPIDAKRPEAWVEDALFQPQSRRAFRRLLALGLTDAVRAAGHGEGVYTFWDYQAGAWNKNNGIRIDHLLLSPQAADRLISADIDRHTRAWVRPSDHVPVRADFDLP